MYIHIRLTEFWKPTFLVIMFQGDSGGPLVIRNGNNFLLIGVVNFVSSRGCVVGLPSGYARVSSFRNWILNNTGI